VRRGAASCRAVLRGCPVTAAAGAGTRSRHGLGAPQTLQSERGLGRPAGIAVVVAVQDVRTPATPLVALSASAVRHADGPPSNWSGGHPVSRHRCPGASGVQVSGVHAIGVQTTGVIQVCGQPGVRCSRPLQPRCPYHAGSRASVRRDRPRLWLAQGSTPHLGRRLAGAQAAAPRWPPGRPRELVQRQVPVGWLGSREGQVLTRRPRRVHPGQVAGVMVDHGAGPGGGDHAPWSLSWCWSRRPAAEGLSGSAGSRRRPQRGRSLSGALSARR
jgi:hypothetical protein